MVLLPIGAVATCERLNTLLAALQRAQSKAKYFFLRLSLPNKSSELSHATIVHISCSVLYLKYGLGSKVARCVASAAPLI